MICVVTVKVMPYVTPREAANGLGVSTRTLARWSQDGKIRTFKTEAGQRRYDLAGYLKQKSEPTQPASTSTILYARVSTSNQLKQLLTSMSDRAGVIIVETNEAYTSKTCGKCGHVHSKLGGNKVFKCPECGYAADRDANGAFNIMLKALVGTPFTFTSDAIEVFSDVGFVVNV